jgi:organic hydroperoxide reductase OsmC/OhrA
MAHKGFTFHAAVDWRLDGDFPTRRYSRAHTLTFDHTLTVPGSPATSIVRPPYSQAGALDPESAFTGAISACHMLWFLDFASRAGFVVAAYHDEAEGTLAKDDAGKLVMTRVVLRPAIELAGDRRPTPEELADLHHRAHDACFIANSVKTEVVVEPC